MFSLVLKSYLALTTFSLSLRILTVESAGFTKEGFRGDPRHYDVSSHNSKVVCYWGTWSNYRPNAGKFTPENINPKLCTHIIYSFAGLEGSSSRYEIHLKNRINNISKVFQLCIMNNDY